MQDQTQPKQENKQKAFYLDRGVLAILRNLTTEEEIQDAYDAYLTAIDEMLPGVIKSYFDRSDISDEERSNLYNEFLTNQENGNFSKELESHLYSDNFNHILEYTINAFNMTLYRQYAPQLSQEDSQKLTKYLETMENANNESMELLINLAKAEKFLEAAENQQDSGTATQQKNDTAEQQNNNTTELQSSSTVEQQDNNTATQQDNTAEQQVSQTTTQTNTQTQTEPPPTEEPKDDQPPINLSSVK